MGGNAVSDRQLLLRLEPHGRHYLLPPWHDRLRPDVTTSAVDPALEDLSRDLVKALVAAGDSYTPGVPPAVQHTLTVLCATAHKKGVPPEGLLALIKKTWKSYMANVGVSFAARDVWYDELISQCIQDFYAAEEG